MKPILIFGLYPRSGTTSFMKAVSSSIISHWLSEPFKEKSNILSSSKKLPKEEVFNTNNIIDKCVYYDIGIVKTLAYQLSDKENIDVINKFTKKIFIYRKYFIDSFLSNWLSHNFLLKTSKLAYDKISIEREKDFYSLVRNSVGISYIIEEYEKTKNIKAAILKNCNFDLLITYENYFNDFRDKNHKNIMKELNLNILSNEYKKYICESQKINSQDFYKKLIPNYEDIISLKDDLIL